MGNRIFSQTLYVLFGVIYLAAGDFSTALRRDDPAADCAAYRGRIDASRSVHAAHGARIRHTYDHPRPSHPVVRVSLRSKPSVPLGDDARLGTIRLDPLAGRSRNLGNDERSGGLNTVPFVLWAVAGVLRRGGGGKQPSAKR